MGNEVSRRADAKDLSPQSTSVVPPHSPCTPTGSSLRRNQSFSMTSPSLSPVASASPSQRRTSSSANLRTKSSINVQKERTIQRMDKAIRRRVRGGITYNMKLLVRGAKGTGKTSLFQRLKGEPIPETHQSTPQLQSATINWNFRQHLEENIKCEVWDVVDEGFVFEDAEDKISEGTAKHTKLQSGPRLSVEAVGKQIGTHSAAIVDATTVDVYHEAHGVIFLVDITKGDTLEYVNKQLDSVPVHIPTLVLGNFRDQGSKRKIFKEDIEEVLYGIKCRSQQQQWKRPTELLYFECSLLNCYGLQSLHQYLGIPFLQLKLATIRQQIRIVGNEFAHVKHNVQATVSEQRYTEYIDHIKATGSDIRTGRRGADTSVDSSATSLVALTEQQKGADDDISVVVKEESVMASPELPTDVVVVGAETTGLSQQEQETAQIQDMEDLPTRTSSVVFQGAPRLKFKHKESDSSLSKDTQENVSKMDDTPVSAVKQSREALTYVNSSPHHSRKASMEEVMHLDDFQAPKPRNSDLDHFYSQDVSDDEVNGLDEDVVVASGHRVVKSTSGAFHKQRFLDSDSSESECREAVTNQRLRKEKVLRKSSSRRTATKQASTKEAVLLASDSSASLLSPSSVSRHKQIRSSERSAQTHSTSLTQQAKAKSFDALSKVQQAFNPTSDGGTAVLVTPHVRPSTAPTQCASQGSKADSAVEEKHSRSSSPLLQCEGEAAQVPMTNEQSRPSETEDAIVPFKLDLPSPLSNRQASKIGESAHYPAEDAIEKMNTLIALVTSPDTSNDSGGQINNQPRKGGQGFAVSRDTDLNYKEIEAASAVNDESEAAACSIIGNGGNTSAAAFNHVAVAEEPVMPHSYDDESGKPFEATSPNNASLSSLHLSLPMPEDSASSLPSASSLLSVSLSATQGQNALRGHLHKKKHAVAERFSSLLSIQASLSLPDENTLASPLRNTTNTLGAYSSSTDDISATTASHLSDLHTNSLKSIDHVCANAVSGNDLETFLNETDSDAENASPTFLEPFEGHKNSNQPDQRSSRDVGELSEDDEKDLERFASYSINKKSRSERRRQQKEDLRRLNDALDPFAPSMKGIAVSDTSFGSSDVLEAIRKAKEEALRMLPAEAKHADDDTASFLPKKKHKQKKERTQKKDKKSSRRHASSSRTQARKFDGDLM